MSRCCLAKPASPIEFYLSVLRIAQPFLPIMLHSQRVLEHLSMTDQPTGSKDRGVPFLLFDFDKPVQN